MKLTMRLVIVLAAVALYATVEAKPQKENSNVDVDMAVVREDECSKGQCFPNDVCPEGNTGDDCMDKCGKSKCCEGHPVECVSLQAETEEITCNCRRD